MTENPPINPVRVLRDAADYLAANGWTQGEYFTPKSEFLAFEGGPCDVPTNESPAACALGGLHIAVTGAPVDVRFGSNATPQQFGAVHVAADIAVKHLHTVYDAAQFTSVWDPQTATWTESTDPTHVLTVWNDREGRTAAEVVTALRAAADQHETSLERQVAFTRSRLIELHKHFWLRLDDENADRQLLLEALLGELGWLADHMDGQEDQS